MLQLCIFPCWVSFELSLHRHQPRTHNFRPKTGCQTAGPDVPSWEKLYRYTLSFTDIPCTRDRLTFDGLDDVPWSVYIVYGMGARVACRLWLATTVLSPSSSKVDGRLTERLTRRCRKVSFSCLPHHHHHYPRALRRQDCAAIVKRLTQYSNIWVRWSILPSAIGREPYRTSLLLCSPVVWT